MKKQILYYLLIIPLLFLSCGNDDMDDEYFVQYQAHSSHFGQPTDFSYTDVDNSIKTADKEISIGPVRKGFVAKMYVSSWVSGRTITISVSKNSSPWLVKESKKLKADDNPSITYTIDF